MSMAWKETPNTGAVHVNGQRPKGLGETRRCVDVRNVSTFPKQELKVDQFHMVLEAKTSGLAMCSITVLLMAEDTT